MVRFRQTAAYFSPAPGHVSGLFDEEHGILTMTLGQAVEIGFVDDWTVDGDSADVRFNDYGNPAGIAALSPLPMIGNQRIFKIDARSIGNVMLQARKRPTMERTWEQMPLVADMQVAVKAASGDVNEDLRRAFNEGAVQFARGYEGARSLFLTALNRGTFGGLPVEHSPELENAMLTLAHRGGIQIMRTFAAPNQSFHGQLFPGVKWVCSCMDVMAYGGSRFLYTVPKNVLIDAAAKLIRDLPHKPSYDFGFVRPVGGEGHSDPSMDVFFEVKTKKQIDDAYHGRSRELSEMLPEAAQQILPALATHNVGYVYADGADHMHVRAYWSSSNRGCSLPGY